MSTFIRSPLLRRLRWPLLIAAGLGLTVWVGGAVAASRARSAANERLAKRGLVLTCEGESWSPWGGVTLTNAALTQLAAPHEPVASISNIHVDLQWWDAVTAREAVTHWQARDATLVAHDEEGAVMLEHFSTSFVVRKGKVEVEQLAARHGPASFDLSGEIVTAPNTGAPPSAEFRLRLKALRGVLSTLKFEPAGGEFAITGTFSLDARAKPWSWNATAKGEGQEVIWLTVPLQKAVSEGQFSQDGMQLSNQLAFAHGSARMEMKREGGWKDTPLRLSGTLTDSAGREDAFRGTYETGRRALEIAELKGKADLLELARNVPALAGKMPRSLQVKTFPEIAARDLNCVWQEPGEPPAWSLARLQLRSSADIAVSIRGNALAVEDITGALAYEDREWQLHELRGRLLGGRFSLQGSYDGHTLSKAELALESLHLSRFSPWLGKINSRLDDSELTLAYRGAICGREPVRSTGSGSLVLTNAPVVHIPVLDQAYSLFPKLLPRKGSGGTGECQMTFTMTKGVAAIDPFKARSESVTVTAKGTVDLVRRHMSGHARANLRGLVGIATSPLSHVLTDMDIEGPLNDVRISPQGPAGAVKKTVRAAKGGVKLSSQVLNTGLTLPFRALGMLDDD